MEFSRESGEDGATYYFAERSVVRSLSRLTYLLGCGILGCMEKFALQRTIDKVLYLTVYFDMEVVAMTKKTACINKWGNSIAVRLPTEYLRATGLKENERVDMLIDGERLVITKAKIPRRTIRELFELHSSDYIEEEEIDFGELIGEEVW